MEGDILFTVRAGFCAQLFEVLVDGHGRNTSRRTAITRILQVSEEESNELISFIQTDLGERGGSSGLPQDG